MRLRVRNTTKAEDRQAADQAKADLPPPTYEQKLQANRIMGLIGAGLIGIVFVMFGYAAYQNAQTIRVEGTVVETGVTTHCSRNGIHRNSEQNRYSHTFEYVDRDGNTQTGTTINDGTDLLYPRGTVVTIGYYPDDPSKVRLRTWFGLWKIQSVLLGLGAVLIAFSIYAVGVVHKEERTRNTEPSA